MNLKTELLPHQIPAVEKLNPFRVGALFMDMGTGKSRTVIELVKRKQDKIHNVVWFCPVSLKLTIQYEILKHTDATFDDIALVMPGKKFKKSFWTIIGIETMSAATSAKLFADSIITESTMVILDESSYIKGHNAKRTKWITLISEKSRYRYILTGTPISNNAKDLYSQFRFLSPKILGYNSFYSFAANHLEYSKKYPGLIVRCLNLDNLAAKIQPYVYQVTKEECLTLPPKLYETRYFSMSDQQRKHYQKAKQEFLEKDIDDITSYDVFMLFTSLQRILSGYTKSEKKIVHLLTHRYQNLIDVIEEIPSTEKILIWAKYVYDVEKIATILKRKLKETAYLYYGKLNDRERNEELQKFRDKGRFLILTPSCGGHGLTITESHYAIFYNNGFKYSERIQAEDRCHRLTQQYPVTYYDLVCADSIDERIMKALQDKQDFAQGFKERIAKIRKDKNKGDLASLIEEL